MKNVASLFPNNARDELKKQLNIEMSNDHDYTEDELSDLYNRIADGFPYEYDNNGEPLELGRIFDILINVFTSNKLIEFAD